MIKNIFIKMIFWVWILKSIIRLLYHFGYHITSSQATNATKNMKVSQQ
jgi:hypothetical protein